MTTNDPHPRPLPGDWTATTTRGEAWLPDAVALPDLCGARVVLPSQGGCEVVEDE